jgi:hypothetical protein
MVPSGPEDQNGGPVRGGDKFAELTTEKNLVQGLDKALQAGETHKPVHRRLRQVHVALDSPEGEDLIKRFHH